MSSSQGPGPTIQLGDLNTQQLHRIILDIEQGIKGLQAQYEALAAGQKRFEASQKAMEETFSAKTKDLLVPMTASIYQEGELVDQNRFIVDIGAGYYLERGIEAHRAYFKKRINQIAESLSKISEVMHERRLLYEQSSLLLQKKLEGARQTTASAGAQQQSVGSS